MLIFIYVRTAISNYLIREKKIILLHPRRQANGEKYITYIGTKVTDTAIQVANSKSFKVIIFLYAYTNVCCPFK